MLEFELLRDKGVLLLRPRGPISTQDFRRIAEAVDPYILENGHLSGMLIEAPAFPGWDSFEAFIDHMRFVRDHHRKIERIAIVTESEFLKLAPRIAEHFAHPTFKVFGTAEMGAALDWLQTGPS